MSAYHPSSGARPIPRPAGGLEATGRPPGAPEINPPGGLLYPREHNARP